MNKVTLSREVADAIEIMRMADLNNREILKKVYSGLDKASLILTGFAELQGFDSLLKALVNGYTVEQTPEDKVKELFRIEGEHDKNGCKAASWILTGALRVLEAYNIKIEGVNK